MQSNHQPKVIYSDKGLANFYGDYIEINKKLKHNKELRDYIVKHELGHSTKFDLAYEFHDGVRLLRNPKIAFKMLAFYLKNPSTWSDLSPIQVKDRTLIYDLNLLILYSLIIGLGIFSLLVF